MSAHGRLCVSVLIAAAGCSSSTGGGGTDPGVDAIPSISYERFSSHTWSVSQVGGAMQLSISDLTYDATHPAPCAASEDASRDLGATGVQIILQIPGTVSGTCPVNNYTLSTHCSPQLGSGAYVPAGCAYYRKFDAQGTIVGMATAIAGEIDLSGSASACTIKANVGFVGATFNEQITLTNGDGVQPWCTSN
ncbi:MAG TPA: hypothetical protein VFK02_17250 [Kofleriaceae bacterium]|nr:hypothetical protein [Kofleriaceae bacterium]